MRCYGSGRKDHASKHSKSSCSHRGETLDARPKLGCSRATCLAIIPKKLNLSYNRNKAAPPWKNPRLGSRKNRAGRLRGQSQTIQPQKEPDSWRSSRSPLPSGPFLFSTTACSPVRRSNRFLYQLLLQHVCKSTQAHLRCAVKAEL